jgi:L-rhamnose isomerase
LKDEQQGDEMNGDLMRRGEVLKRLGVDVSTLKAMVESPDVPLGSVRLVPGGQRFFVREQVEALRRQIAEQAEGGLKREP